MGFTSEITQGMTIRHNGELYTIIEREFAAMGKGSSFNRCKFRNVISGKVIPITIKSGEKVEEVEVEKQTMQFLYIDGKTVHFMSPETFEQVEYDLEGIPYGTDFLHESCKYIASKYEGRVIAVTLPIKVTLEVTNAPEGVKGDTVSNMYKEVVLETGAKIQAPLFVKVGDKIIINTEERSYVSKA